MSSITDTFEEFCLKFPEHLFCRTHFSGCFLKLYYSQHVVFQNWVNTDIFKQHFRQPIGITKILEYSFVSSFKSCRFQNVWFKNFVLNILNVPMFKTSSCICTKVLLRNSTCNILLQLSKGKRGSVISGIVGRECIEFMREPPSRDHRVNSLHRFGARSYKNAFESLHLHLYILKLLSLST